MCRELAEKPKRENKEPVVDDDKCKYWDYLIQHVCRELAEKPKRENKEPVVDDDTYV